MDTMTGRRMPDVDADKLVPDDVQHGDYWRDSTGTWWICPPRGSIGRISNHTVVEHDDGTITASPSILMTSGDSRQRWHGYLEKGVWREC